MRAWQRTTVTTRKECYLVKSCLEGKFIKVWLLPRLGGQGDGQAKTYRCLIQMVETPAKIMKKNPNIIPNGLDSILFGKGFNVLSRSDITGYFANIILRKQESKNGGEDASSKVCESTVPSYKFGAISQENGWVQTRLYKQRMSSCKITLKLVLLFEILF